MNGDSYRLRHSRQGVASQVLDGRLLTHSDLRTPVPHLTPPGSQFSSFSSCRWYTFSPPRWPTFSPPLTQSVKNTDSAGNKGYDAGKKVSGIKRHIAVDTQGLPHAIHITTANVTDRAGALAMFDRHRDGLNQVQNVLVDGGYTGKPFAAGVRSLLGAAVEVVKRNELHTFVVLPKRWVVERSFAWLEKCRRLWKNCERKLNTSLQMVVLAFATLILKRL